MAPQNWLSLADLGQIYGISAIHCGRALQKQGWRNQHGLPTPKALEMGAASNEGIHTRPKPALWNEDICKKVLEKTGYQPISKALQVEQWAKLLEALEEGSPSINATADQMAEELPLELVKAVNDQLAIRGSDFRVKEIKSASRI